VFREEPIERFRQRALLAARRLAFDPALVNEAVATLVACFGTAWLEEVTGRPMRGASLPFRDHPIGGILHTAGDVQIAEALELAAYLKAASESAAFKTIVDGLKAQYRPTLLQLAFHYRISLMADEPPDLEPAAEGGRLADIAFSHKGQAYLVECYAPGTRSHELDEVHWLLTKGMEAIGAASGYYTVSICLSALPTAAERKDVQKAIASAVASLEDMASATRASDALIERSPATVSVVRSAGPLPPAPGPPLRHRDFPGTGGPHMRNYLKEVLRSQVTSLGGAPTGGTVRHEVAVWLPDEHTASEPVTDDDLESLVPKLKKKLAQTKRAGDRRILVVDTWIARPGDGFTPEAQAAAESALFEQHADVTGVLLVSRTYDDAAHRHRYYITPLVNLAAEPQVLLHVRDQEARLLVPPGASV